MNKYSKMRTAHLKIWLQSCRKELDPEYRRMDMSKKGESFYIWASLIAKDLEKRIAEIEVELINRKGIDNET